MTKALAMPARKRITTNAGTEIVSPMETARRPLASSAAIITSRSRPCPHPPDASTAPAR